LWFSAYRERRQVNRAFRRQQREFDSALGACEGQPNAQRELHTIWSLRD
jgi:hypothetical protein